MTLDKVIEMARDTLENRRIPLLTEKGKSYSNDEDTLTNFKRAAFLNQISPQLALIIYLNKHIDAIVTWANTGQESEPIETRIDDAINYLDLLRALVREKPSFKSHVREWTKIGETECACDGQFSGYKGETHSENSCSWYPEDGGGITLSNSEI